MSKPVAGVQLWTVRDFCKTMPEIVQTFKKIRKIGYTAVQLSGHGPVDPNDLAKAVKDEGLKVAGAHDSWDRFKNHTDDVIAEYKLWGTTHTAIGSLVSKWDLEILNRFLAELAVVGPKLVAAGLDFSFHNHNIEFIKVDGRLILDLLYEKSDPRFLKAELDTYWVQAGGGCPQEWVRKLAGRQPLLHLKDYTMIPGESQPRFAPVGEGNLDWPAILAAAQAGGVEYCLVEQDECYGMDPFEALTISYRNLRALGLE